jgi:hypothetical protein
LRAVLLDLQRDKVAYLAAGGAYRPAVENPNIAQGMLQDYAVQEVARKKTVQLAAPAVLRLIERESGHHTTDELIRRCHDEHIEIRSDEDVYGLIADFRTRRLVNSFLNEIDSLPHRTIAPLFCHPAQCANHTGSVLVANSSARYCSASVRSNWWIK